MAYVSSQLDTIIRENIKDESVYRMIRQMIESERAPAEEQTRYLKQLHHLATTHYDTLEEMFEAYLSVGCDVLHLPEGVVSFIDANIYHIEASYPDATLAKKQFKLDDVLCKWTVRRGKTQSFVNMNSMPDSPKPDVESLDHIENYLGTPLRLNGDIWGTISFSGDIQRDNAFSQLDIEFIELMAQGISNALDSASKQQLQELAENRYRLMFENINTPVILYEVQTYDIIDVNQSAIDFYGYSYEEFMEISAFDLNMLPQRDIENRILENRAAGRAYTQFPHRLKSGDIREIEAYMSDLEMDGRLVRFAVIYDYSERHEAEEALKHSEANLRAIFDTASQFMFLIDDTSKIVAMNRSARKLIEDMTDTNPGIENTIPNRYGLDAARYLVSDYIMFALQGKTIQHETNITLPQQDKPIYIDYRYVPVKTADDTIIGVCVTGQDITTLKSSQEQLSRERNILRALIDNLPDSIYIKDANARILTANHRYVETTASTSIEDVIGKNAIDLFPRNGVEYYHDDVQVLSGNKLIGKHESLFEGDQIVGTHETSKIPLYNEHNHIVGLVGVERDITKQLEVEQALQRRDAILNTISIAAQEFLTNPAWREGIKTVLENLGHAIDIDRAYVYQNVEMDSGLGSIPVYEWLRDGVQAHFEYRDDRITKWAVGRWVRQFVRGNMIYGNASDMEPDEEKLMRERDVQSIVMIPVMVGTYWWGVIGFDCVFAPRTWFTPELDALMTAASTLGSAIEREQMEQGIRENEEKFTQLITHIPETFWIYDIYNQSIVYASDNYETMFGVSLADRQRDVNLFLAQVHPEDRQLVTESLAKQSRGEASEYEARFKKGNIYRWASIRIYPIRDIEGQTYRVAGVASDITERKQAEKDKLEMLAQRERVAILSQFVRDSTHEFKTPLSIINTRLYLMEKSDDPEIRHNNLQLIREQVKGISQLIESLVLMSRLDSRAEITMKPMNINTLLRQMDLSLRDNYAERADDIRMILDDEIPPIIGNLIYITEAVKNLVDNAVRYSSEGQQIAIRSFQDEKHVVIEVQDNGIGISEDEMTEIFKRFWRKDIAHSTRGFGLGLPIAQRIAQRHGGDVTVESEPEKGAIFRILFPKIVVLNN